MKYEDRIAICRRELVAMLDRFTPPRGMSDDAQVKMVTSIAESLNRKLPITNEDGFREALRKTFDRVQDTHESYAWPPQASFVKAVPIPVGAGKKAPETFSPDDLDVPARLMNAGETVPESHVWGTLSARLLNSGHVSRAVMDEYRKSSAKSHFDLYGGASAHVLASRYGDHVLAYFPASERAAG